MVKAGKLRTPPKKSPARESDAAREWALAHGVDLEPAEPTTKGRTKSIDRDKDGESMHDRLPGDGPSLADLLVKRVNLGQAPAGFDADLGVVMPGDPPPEPEAAVRERWARLVTDLLPHLGASSGYRRVMPAATPPASELAQASKSVTARLASALPELEALYRKLLPGWREPVRGWLQQILNRKVELQYRPAAAKSKAPGLKNRMALAPIASGEDLLKQLTRSAWGTAGPGRPVLGDLLPASLTAGMLNAAAARIGRKQRDAWSIERAMASIEDWCRDPKKFARYVQQNSE